MSKKSKSEAKERRRKEKRARKASQRARYEDFKARGVNTKSKRAKLRKQRMQGDDVRVESHASGPCHNAGCTTCYPQTFSPVFFQSGKPHHMPQRLYLRWKAQQADG